MRTKKKKQLLYRITTFITLFALLFTFSGFAGGGGAIASPQIIKEDDIYGEEPITGEVLELRGEFEKHFVNEDGTVTAYSYANPIHYQNENGNWIDIDNTLIRNEDGFVNTDNPNEIRLSAVAKDNNLVSIRQGEYEISWGIQGARNVQGYETDKPEKTDRKDLVTLVSKVAYDNVFENTSLAFTLYSYSISEDLIFDSVPSFDQVTYNIRTQNLVAVQEGNEVIFFSTIEGGKEIIRFKAPYMYDSAFALTYDITVAFQATEVGYRLTYVLDRQWLQSEERVYPVTLDPTLYSWQHYSNIEDTHTSSSNPGINYAQAPFLYLGKVSGESRTFVRITNMPALTTGATVDYAQFDLVHSVGTTTSGIVDAYRMMSSWDSFTLTWNNQGNYQANLYQIDIGLWISGAVGLSGYRMYCIDVTNMVDSWYKGNLVYNYGIMLKYQNPNYNDYNTLYSSDNGSIASTHLPIVWIIYTPYGGGGSGSGPALYSGKLLWPIGSINYYVTSSAIKYENAIADAAYSWVYTGWYNNLWPNTRTYVMSNSTVDFYSYYSSGIISGLIVGETRFYSGSSRVYPNVWPYPSWFWCEIHLNDYHCLGYLQNNYTLLKAAIAHEFGHVWGLDHASSLYSIMYPDTSFLVRTPQKIDNDAFNLKYP